MPAQSWVTLIVGSVAAIGAIITWQQKNRADSRSEWWRRTAWAFERAFGDDAVQAQLGWNLLRALLRSTLATADDAEIIRVIAAHATLDEVDQEDPDGN